MSYSIVDATQLRPSVVVPRAVTVMLRRSQQDLEWITQSIDQAIDVDWISDIAGLYRMRLLHVRRLIQSLRTRVREADTAVYVLSRST